MWFCQGTGVVGFPEVSSDRQTGPYQPGGYSQSRGMGSESIGTNRSETCCMSFQECLTRIVSLRSPLPCSPVWARVQQCRDPQQQLLPEPRLWWSRGSPVLLRCLSQLMCTRYCPKSPGSSGAAGEAGSSSPAQAAWPNTPSAAHREPLPHCA